MTRCVGGNAVRYALAMSRRVTGIGIPGGIGAKELPSGGGHLPDCVAGPAKAVASYSTDEREWAIKAVTRSGAPGNQGAFELRRERFGGRVIPVYAARRTRANGTSASMHSAGSVS